MPSWTGEGRDTGKLFEEERGNGMSQATAGRESNPGRCRSFCPTWFAHRWVEPRADPSSSLFITQEE